MRQIGLLRELADEVFRQRHSRRFQALLECFGAFLADQGVRVVAVGQEQKADLPALPRLGQRVLQGAPRGGPPRTVAIEREHDLGDQPEDSLEVLGGGRRPERRDGVREAGLMQPDGIHVPFDNEQALEVRAAAARLVQAVELAALVEEHGLRGVEVLGLTLIDDAAAEGDDAAAGIADGKHEPVAEAVVVAFGILGASRRLSPLALDDQAEICELAALAVRAAEALQHLVPGVGRVADSEPLHRLAVQSPFDGVLLRTLIARERLGIELRDASHDFVQRLIGPPRTRCGGSPFVRHVQAQAGGELLDRFRKGHPVVLHQEPQHRAVRAAAEAVIELLVRAHPE